MAIKPEIKVVSSKKGKIKKMKMILITQISKDILKKIQKNIKYLHNCKTIYFSIAQKQKQQLSSLIVFLIKILIKNILIIF